MESDPEYKKQWRRWLWFWAFAGLWLRLLIMPLTVHDDFVVLHHPVEQVASGQLDIFSDYSKQYSSYTRSTPYPPLYYYITGFFRYFADILSPTLPLWMDHCWDVYKNQNQNLHPVDYYRDHDKYKTFRNLFLIKGHYLFFDLLIALILLNLVQDHRKRVWAMALWMLNPIVLHSMYGHGQMDLIPTAMVIVSLFLFTRRKPGPALAFLSCGAMVKLYPVFFILPMILLCSRSLKEAVRLTGWALAPFILILGPLYLQTDGVVMSTFLQYEVYRRLGQAEIWLQLQKLVFVLGYLGLCLWIFRSRTNEDSQSAVNLIRIFATVLLLMFLGTPVELRYFVWITPLLVLLMVRSSALFWLACVQTLSLLVLRAVPQQSIQLGLFRPLLPEFFMAIPSLNTLISTILPTVLIYKAMYRLFLLATFLILIWQWWPYVSKRILKKRVVVNASRWITVGILVFIAVLSVWGSISYKNSLPRGEHFLRFGVATNLRVYSQAGKTAERKLLYLPASFEAKADGFYRIRSPLPDQTNRYRERIDLFRLNQIDKFKDLQMSGESTVPSFGRDFVFQPIENSSGKTFELELLMQDIENTGQLSTGLTVLTYYTWYRDAKETVQLMISRLASDRAFFIFYVISLGFLVILSLTTIYRAKQKTKYRNNLF